MVTETVLKPNHLKYWIQLAVKFFTLQILGQVIAMITSIIIIRTLTKSDYALFVLANSFIGMLSTVSDSGVTTGIMAMAGKITDSKDFDKLIKQSGLLKNAFYFIAIAAILPVIIWSFYKNELSINDSIITTLFILSNSYFLIRNSIIVVAIKLKEKYIFLQKVDFLINLSKLIFIIILYHLFSVNVILILVITLVVSISQNILYRQIINHYVDVSISIDRIESRKIKSGIIFYVKRNLANALFYVFQGQISYMILTYFGNISGIAEMGAITRISIIYSIFGAFSSSVLIPKIIKIQEPRSLLRFSLIITGFSACIGCLLTTFCWVFSKEILLVLGNQYKNLQTELVLASLGAGFIQVSTLLSAIVLNKGWLPNRWWLYIPITVVTQIFLANVMSIGNLKQVLLFGIYSDLPILLFNTIMFLISVKQYSTHYYLTHELKR